MSMKIAIRADGNSAIGFGHLVRTQALARQMEKGGAEVIFLTQNPENIDAYKVFGLDPSMNYWDEDEAVAAYLAQYGINMLIIDSYAYDQSRLDRMGELPIATVYIDDMNRYRFNSCWLINGNLYAPRLDYRGQAKFLFGADYLMMREDFAALAARKVRPQVGDILITCGAADMENITPQLLKIIFAYRRFDNLRWHVVIGPAFQNQLEIELLAGEKDNIFIYHSPVIKDLMEICDISISAAGSTSYELAACGVPALLLVAVDNQLMLAEELQRQCIAVNLGWYDRMDRELLYRELDRLIDDEIARQSMASRGQATIDGRGAERLAKLLIEYAGGTC